MLCKYGGMTQREVAERLGLRTGVAVSHQISRLKASLQEQTALRATVGRIDAQLAERRKVAMSYGKGSPMELPWNSPWNSLTPWNSIRDDAAPLPAAPPRGCELSS